MGKTKLILITGIIFLLFIGCTENELVSKGEEITIKEEGGLKVINEEVFVSTGNHNEVNMVLIIDGDKAALIDTGYEKEEAERIEKILDERELKLETIIITCFENEKLNNLKMFKNEGTQVYTSNSVKDDQLIELGNKKLKLLITQDHSKQKRISVDVDEKFLVAGNLINNNEKSYTGVTIQDYKNILESLEKLKAVDYSIIIPGHGNLVEDNSIIEKEINVINTNLSKHNIKEAPYWAEIDDDVFMSSGDLLRMKKATMVLVKSGEDAILIDTGLSEEMALKIKKVIDEQGLDLKNIILTHKHYDHINQLGMFEQEVDNIYTYDNTEDGQVIKIGDRELKIVYTPGHAENKHLSVVIDNEILVAGDILTSNINPNDLLDNKEEPEILIDTLNSLKDNNYSIIIPGHGDVCLGNAVIKKNIDSLEMNINQ